MDEREQLIELLTKHEPRKADAIVLLAGDRFHRIPKVAELYHAGRAPLIVVTSSADNWDYGSQPSSKLVPELLKHNIRPEHIISEETGPHTRAEADATFRLAKEHGWTTLLLVTTEYHQYRAFLTWLKAMRDNELDIELVMTVVYEFPDFYNETREEALVREFEKIEVYGAKGDVATYTEGIAYLSR